MSYCETYLLAREKDKRVNYIDQNGMCDAISAVRPHPFGSLEQNLTMHLFPTNRFIALLLFGRFDLCWALGKGGERARAISLSRLFHFFLASPTDL